jgi:hypothetical protein
MRGLVQALKVLVEAVRVLIKSVRVLVEAVRVQYYCSLIRENGCRGHGSDGRGCESACRSYDNASPRR